MARTVVVGQEALGSGLFEPAPAGTKVRATIHEITEDVVKSDNSPNKGQPQGVVTVKIIDDFNFQGSDGKPQNLKGREVRYNNVPFYHDSKNAWVLGAFAQAVGWPVTDDGSIEIPEQGELWQTQGKEIVVQLGVRTNNNDGKTYNTVARWLPAGSKTSAGAAPAGGGSPAGGVGDPWA